MTFPEFFRKSASRRSPSPLTSNRPVLMCPHSRYLHEQGAVGYVHVQVACHRPYSHREHLFGVCDCDWMHGRPHSGLDRVVHQVVQVLIAAERRIERGGLRGGRAPKYRSKQGN